MSRARRLPIFLLILFSAACGRGGSVTVTGAGSEVAGTAPSTVPGAQVSREIPATLLFTSRDRLLGNDLFLASTAAKDAVPGRWDAGRLSILEAVPAGMGRMAAIGRDEFGAGYAILLLQLATGRTFTLHVAGLDELSNLAISPNQSWLAVSRTNAISGARSIRLVRVADALAVEVPSGRLASGPGAALDSAPEFTPDGTSLSFEREDPSTRSVTLNLVTLPAGEETSLSTPISLVTAAPGQRVRALRTSPGLSTFAYLLSEGGAGARLYLKSAQGPARAITAPGETAWEPSWSPDGQKLLFWAETRESQSLRIYEPALALTRAVATLRIARPTPGIACPTWSASGNEIFYASESGSGRGIFKVDRNSREVTRITDPALSRAYVCPRVLPGGGAPK